MDDNGMIFELFNNLRKENVAYFRKRYLLFDSGGALLEIKVTSFSLVINKY